MTIVNAFTVDVEDYFHVSGFERYVRRDDWESYPSRVVANTKRIMGLLQKHDVTATFFVLGWVADRFPDLIREVAAAGHDIGSHSYWHRRIYLQTPDEFREDLRRSRSVLEDVAGKPVTSFRAPTFSITRRSLWALDVLADEGFKVDSSIFPIRHDRYGIPGAKVHPHAVDTTAGRLWEFPMPTVQIAGRRLPIGGGGYFRIYPINWTLRGLAAINRGGAPFVFYIHPWEIDPGQPKVAGPSRIAEFRHRIKLNATAQRLDNLLRRFRFASLEVALQASRFSSTEINEADPTYAAVSPQSVNR